MRVVVKIGSSSITDDAGTIDTALVAAVCDQVAEARSRGHEVLVVSSGAVAAGVAALHLPGRPNDVGTLQALAAAGQIRLMAVYDTMLARHGLVAAQVLLVPNDFVDRRQYLHARATIRRLLALGCVPVVNENDAIAADGIRYGDNDHIAALLAHAVDADLLLLLTDTPGLYTLDPRRHADAELVRVVRADDPLLGVAAGRTGSARGSGGMASKLSAARIASWSGARAVIALARREDVVLDAIDGADELGTTFLGRDRKLSARKLWIAFASRIAGTVVVDDGARRALVDGGRSLLPAGVTEVRGQFDDAATVVIASVGGDAVARGMVAMDAMTIRRVAGMRTAELPPDTPHEVIHRDDMVLLPA